MRGRFAHRRCGYAGAHGVRSLDERIYGVKGLSRCGQADGDTGKSEPRWNEYGVGFRWSGCRCSTRDLAPCTWDFFGQRDQRGGRACTCAESGKEAEEKMRKRRKRPHGVREIFDGRWLHRR